MMCFCVDSSLEISQVLLAVAVLWSNVLPWNPEGI